MIWPLWAFLHMLLWSAANQLNHHWQLPGLQLTRWRTFLPPLIALPVTFLVPPPLDPLYWAATLTSAAMVNWHDSTLLNASARFGGQVAFRVRALILPLVFLTWLVVTPEQISALLKAPLISAGILAALGATSFFLGRLARCTISREAMLHMLPVLLTGVVFEVTNKTAMDHASFPANTLYYVFTVSGAPLLFSLACAGKNAPQLVKGMASIARQGTTYGAIMVVSMSCKNLGMMHSPNPAYVTAITLTAPFWIMFYLKLRGEKEAADWVAGTGMVLSIIALTLLASAVPH